MIKRAVDIIPRAGIIDENHGGNDKAAEDVERIETLALFHNDPPLKIKKPAAPTRATGFLHGAGSGT